MFVKITSFLMPHTCLVHMVFVWDTHSWDLLLQGWTAASLANLMNEAAIMTVRRNTDVITLPMVLDIVEGNSFGGTAPKLPRGEAKNRYTVLNRTGSDFRGCKHEVL